MKKTPIQRFLTSKPVIAELSNNYTLSHESEKGLTEWFEIYDPRQSRDWFKQICIWIKLNKNNFVSSRKEMEEYGIYRNDLTMFKMKFGEVDGQIRYDTMAGNRPCITDAISNIAESKNISKEELLSTFGKKAYKVKLERGIVKNTDNWRKQGFSEIEILEKSSNAARRDLTFFVTKYGELEGNKRYNQMIEKRKKAWDDIDKKEHSLKTMINNTNVSVQELEILNKFILVNNLDIGKYKLMYGANKDQFYQYIPNIGYRRYDLAIFENNELIMIVEYHGMYHINFSDYNEEMRDEPIPFNTGVISLFAPTYGKVYDNDMAKRNHILSKFPNAKYIVIWPDDIKNNNYKIENLI